MNCKLCQHEIDQSELDQDLSREAVKHIESCIACRSFKNERESLRSLLGTLERVAAPANFDARLRARLTRSKTEQHTVWFLQPSFLRAAYVSLPILMIVIGVALTKPLAYFSGGEKALNEVSSLSSINVDEMSADKIQTAVVIVPPFDLERTDGPKRTHNNFAVRTRKERPEIFDIDFNSKPPKVDIPPEFGEQAIIVPIHPELRSHYVIVNGKKVPLRSVTFGSQDLIEGNEARTAFTSSAQRVW